MKLNKRWPVEVRPLVHRVGLVKVNEPSLWVEVIAPHREAAFATCQWLIDEMKRVVPIWKEADDVREVPVRVALMCKLEGQPGNVASS